MTATQLIRIQNLFRVFLAHCETGEYSGDIRILQDAIHSFLFKQSVKEITEHLLWLQIKLYEVGILLFHFEDEHYSMLKGDCHPIDNLDFSLAFFEEALELAYVMFGTNQNMSTLAPLTQIGLVLNAKGLCMESLAVLSKALDVSCHLESSNDVLCSLNLSECKLGLLRTLGDIHHDMGNLIKAKEFYTQAIEYYKLDEVDSEGFEDMLYLLEVIGRLLQRLEGMNSKDAAEYFELADDLRKAHEWADNI